MAGATKVWDPDTSEWVYIHSGPKGDAGLGLPPGGTTGQVAVKQSNDNYDTAWAEMSGGSSGTGGPLVGLTIVELSVGVWSGDAPADRLDGANPILFIPFDPDNPTDPADPTDGIDTPANIRDWDRLGPVTVGSL